MFWHFMPFWIINNIIYDNKTITDNATPYNSYNNNDNDNGNKNNTETNNYDDDDVQDEKSWNQIDTSTCVYNLC